MLLKKNILRLIIALAFLPMSLGLNAQADGKALFKKNCKSCHNENMKSDMTGPALGGVQQRWADAGESEANLYEWIRNSQGLVAAGNEYAVNIFNEWNKSVMTSFQGLTDEEIGEILLYIEGAYDPQGSAAAGNKYGQAIVDANVATTTSTDAGTGSESGSNNMLYLGILLGVLILLALLLSRIISNLNHMAKVKAGEDPGPRKTLVETLTSKGFVSIVIFALIVLGGFTTLDRGIALGRQQEYQPTQPINFSHEIHAGINKIECQYCHDGARRSKHAVIPATNTCMNCHTAIKGETLAPASRAEITKIYASAGWNPNNNQYIEGYEKMSKADVEAIYRTWVTAGYNDAENKKSDGVIAKNVDEHMSGIMSIAQKPIEWVRIHNLPDHAYFNHAQHVSVGKIECQTCHGPVEEMPEVYQYAPLSMGWCINCHRQTEVQFKDNEYYQAYEQYHEDLKSGKIDKVTVEDIGGLECQKCHY